jgi:hypothetical protein
MVGAFGDRLQHSLAGLNLAPVVVHEIQSSVVRLAGLEVPAGLDAQTSSAVRDAIAHAFVFAFRVVMLLCAGLAVASAAVAARMIPSRALARR